jgi:hypothetical protein
MVSRIATFKAMLKGLAAVGRPSGAKANGPGWAKTIGRVLKDLEDLNRSTERDFLAVGEKLIEFRSIARQIASDMEALTELISGEHGRQASEALHRMLDHSRELDTRMEQGSQAL